MPHPPEFWSKNAKISGGAPMGRRDLPFGTDVEGVEMYLPTKFHPLPVKNVAGNEVQSLTFGAP